jgi:hypothetical protein
MNSSSNNSIEKTWTTTIENAEDGSGDGILTLPPELCEIQGWKEGTVLEIDVIDGCIYISEKTA